MPGGVVLSGLSAIASTAFAASEPPPPPPKITAAPSLDIAPPSYVLRVEGTCSDYSFVVRLTQAREADGFRRLTSSARYKLLYDGRIVDFDGPASVPPGKAHILFVHPSCDETSGLGLTTVYYDYEKESLVGVKDNFLRGSHYTTYVDDLEDVGAVMGFAR